MVNTEEMLIETATGFVAWWNETSEKEGIGKGVVHNAGISRQKPGFVEISMNLGSALAPFLEQFLLHLNGVEGLERVRLTSYGGNFSSYLFPSNFPTLNYCFLLDFSLPGATFV